MVTRGDAWMRLGFAPPNTLSDTNQHFEKAPIIQERFVDLVELKDYFIPSCFEEKIGRASCRERVC